MSKEKSDTKALNGAAEMLQAFRGQSTGFPVSGGGNYAPGLMTLGYHKAKTKDTPKIHEPR